MNWLTRYRLQYYVRNSIWLLPLIAIAAGLVTVTLLSRLDGAMGWKMNIQPETSRTVMSTVAASMFTLVVLVASAVLVAVQLASAQLTPRIIAFVYQNTARKSLLAVFVFTFTLSVGTLVRIEDSAPLLTGYVAAYGFLINLVLFLYFIDIMGKTLRPSTILRNVALMGREVIRSVYPGSRGARHPAAHESNSVLDETPRRIILNQTDGAVLAFDLKGIVSLAERANCVIELIPQVGDYVAAGDPLFRFFEGGEDLAEEALLNSVALGQERTLEQDPMFAFRIIVDIASKALSPAINDPTTAVLAVDQIHHLLREVGGRTLAEGREKDSAGQVRLMYRTPNWDDFVQLAVTEIRHYGRDSIQVVRRLRAMLENLIETLPERRTILLRKELRLLETSARRTFADADDQTLADTGDLQGMGGSAAERRKHYQVQSTVAGSINSTGNSTASPVRSEEFVKAAINK